MRIPIAFAAMLLIVSSGCEVFGSGTQDYIVRVDSIAAPSSIGPDEPLTIRFLGSIGPSGCYRLVDIRSARGPNVFEIRFDGEYRNALCTLDPIPLDHEVQLPPPFQDPFRIRVIRPSDPPLERTVRIQ